MHTTPSASARSHRPRAYTVFGAAFVAGAAAAFGVNSVLDAHLAQSRPQVESESILVALRSLPAGSPVTVWDVGLKDWPKAMVPAAAMRVTDDLDNLVARHPLREGQPVLAVQLTRIDGAEGTTTKTVEVVSTGLRGPAAPERDLWDPGQSTAPPRDTVAARPPTRPETPPPAITTATAPTVARPKSEPVATVAPPTAPPTTPITLPPATPTTSPATTPAAGPQQIATAATAPVATVEETLTLPNVPPAADAGTATPTATEPSPPPAVADATPAGAGPVAVTEPSTTTITASSPSASSDDEPVRTATRPHPSSIRFLAVPEPESLEADSEPPVPDEGSTAWVGDAEKPAASVPPQATAEKRGTSRGGTASAPRSARAQPQSQRQQPARKQPQRGQRTAVDPRGSRSH